MFHASCAALTLALALSSVNGDLIEDVVPTIIWNILKSYFFVCIKKLELFLILTERR